MVKNIKLKFHCASYYHITFIHDRSWYKLVTWKWNGSILSKKLCKSSITFIKVNLERIPMYFTLLFAQNMEQRIPGNQISTSLLSSCTWWECFLCSGELNKLQTKERSVQNWRFSGPYFTLFGQKGCFTEYTSSQSVRIRENTAQQKLRIYISEKALFMQCHPGSFSMAPWCPKVVNTSFIGINLYPLCKKHLHSDDTNGALQIIIRCGSSLRVACRPGFMNTIPCRIKWFWWFLPGGWYLLSKFVKHSTCWFLSQ